MGLWIIITILTKRNRRTPNPPSDNHDRKTMTIEYDEEDRCIRVDGEPISYGVAVGLLEQIEQAIDEWDFDHAPQCYNPDGHYDD